MTTRRFTRIDEDACARVRARSGRRRVNRGSDLFNSRSRSSSRRTVDAGWSGARGRGWATLTKARGVDARAFVECVCVANASMALVARDVAIRRGMDGTRAFAKTLVVGFVGVVDACFGAADAPRPTRERDATTRGGGRRRESSRRAM